MNEGMCHGGPMDGQAGQSRFPKGFLLVDKPNNKAWLYDWRGDTGCFDARDNGRAMDLEDGSAWRAAEEQDYDVRAVEPA